MVWILGIGLDPRKASILWMVCIPTEGWIIGIPGKGPKFRYRIGFLGQGETVDFLV
jgi:hypothetical protein